MSWDVFHMISNDNILIVSTNFFHLKSCQLVKHSPTAHFEPIYFEMDHLPAAFSFIFVGLKQLFHSKSCRQQQNSNSDHWNWRQARWPLDHHQCPSWTNVLLHTYTSLIRMENCVPKLEYYFRQMFCRVHAFKVFKVNNSVTKWSTDTNVSKAASGADEHLHV